jgi:SAM-dependent methyltransferase
MRGTGAKKTMKASYGIDAPGVIRNFFLAAAALLASAFWLPPIPRGFAVWTGGIFALEGAAMLAYALLGKFRHRDRMLGLVAWRGGERVLDVGTGRGLLMIGAARRLSSGMAVGVDIWNAQDLSGNGPERTLENARLEGVADKIELKTEDARKMSFADASFDVVVSNLALHNIDDAAGRDQACREIARVLKPGGRALISDFRHTAQYAAAFSAAGLRASRHGPYLLDTFPPLAIVEAVKS